MPILWGRIITCGLTTTHTGKVAGHARANTLRAISRGSRRRSSRKLPGIMSKDSTTLVKMVEPQYLRGHCAGIYLLPYITSKGDKVMKKPLLLLIVAVLLSQMAFARADNTIHEAALFIKNAWDPAAPMAFWVGDAEHPPTFYFHMLHQQWQDGASAIKSEGTKLLGCTAPIIGTIFEVASGYLPAWNDSQYHYHVLVSPPPPGGAVTVAVEGTVHQGECAPGLEAQKLFLHVL